MKGYAMNTQVFKEVEVDLSGIIDVPRKKKSKKVDEHVYGFDYKEKNSFDGMPAIPSTFTNHELKVAKRVLCMCAGFIESNKTNSKVFQFPSLELQALFGRNEFGFNLSKSLLIIEDGTWNFNPDRGDKRCKTFSVNLMNFFALSNKIGYTLSEALTDGIKEVATTHHEELMTGNFKYQTVHYRQYHPIIRMNRLKRDRLMYEHGYKFEIDGCAFAPSVITAVAKKYGHKIPKRLTKFIANPRQTRKDMASELDVPVEVVKLAINAVIHGAQIRAKNRTATFTEIDDHSFLVSYTNAQSGLMEICGSESVFYRLTRKGGSFRKFNSDLSNLFHKIDKDGEILVPDDFTKKLNRGRKTYLLYSRYEQQIQNLIQQEVNSIGERTMMVHDGAYLSSQIDVNKLQKCVMDELGIDVRFEIKDVEIIS
jgi:hypothetical protein